MRLNPSPDEKSEVQRAPKLAQGGTAGPSDPTGCSSASGFSPPLVLPSAPQPGSQPVGLVLAGWTLRLGCWPAAESSGDGAPEPSSPKAAGSLGIPQSAGCTRHSWPAMEPRRASSCPVYIHPQLPRPTATTISMAPTWLLPVVSASSGPPHTTLSSTMSAVAAVLTHPLPQPSQGPSRWGSPWPGLSPGSWAPLCSRQHGLLAAPTCGVEQVVSLCGPAQH